MVDRNGIAIGASGCAMTKLGCAFTSSGAPTSSISSGRRGCCAKALPKVINIKPQPKIGANQCRVVIFFVFIFLSEAEFCTALTAIHFRATRGRGAPIKARPTPRDCYEWRHSVTGVVRQGENSSKTSLQLRTERLRRSVREPNRARNLHHPPDRRTRRRCGSDPYGSR